MSKIRLLLFPLLLFCLAGIEVVRADEIAAPRIGRVSAEEGSLSLRAAGGEWGDAAVNDPVAAGMSLRTADKARAQLRVGPDKIALSSGTRIEIGRLERGVMQIALPQGRIGIHLARIEAGASVEIDLPRGGVWLLAPGDYDISAGDEKNPPRVVALDGRAHIVAPGIDHAVAGGSAAMLKGPNEVTATEDRALDEFVAWWRPGDEVTPQALRYVSAEMTGYDALDGKGRWEDAKGYGAVWYPEASPEDWAPYRYGHWRWLSAWGWTWIDDMPWGFAPSHYGRWAQIDERWAWVPGPRREHPVYVPAAVAFLGTAGVGLSYPDANGPAVAWFPLAPGEAYWPSYTSDLDAIRDINAGAVVDPAAIEAGANGGPPAFIVNGDYRNRRYASVVPRPVFAAGRATAPALIELPSRRLQNAPLLAGSPQIPPAATAPVRQQLARAAQALVRILAPRPASPRVAVHTTAVLRGKAEPPRLATKVREAFRANVQVARARVAANAARATRSRVVQVAAVNRRGGTH